MGKDDGITSFIHIVFPFCRKKILEKGQFRENLRTVNGYETKNSPKTRDFFEKAKKFSKKLLTNSEKGYIMQYGKELARANSKHNYNQVYGGIDMNLREAIEGKEYIIKQINTDDEELNAFLFSLGCYDGEKITVVTHRKGGCTVSVKDARYSIDTQLAEAIIV